jgi:hypothetical protein
MLRVCLFRAAQFAPGSPLATRLLATGTRDLVEGNNWGDSYWCDARAR